MNVELLEQLVDVDFDGSQGQLQRSRDLRVFEALRAA